MIVLVAAFCGWMFGGLEIALFVLIHRPAMVSMLREHGELRSASDSNSSAIEQTKHDNRQLDSSGRSVDERTISRWFAWYQAAFLFGAAAGGWLFGWMGDRFGRTRTLGFSILCYSLLTGCCIFARSPEELLVLRFLACFGIGGAWPNTVALVAEAWPDASRPFLAGLLGTAANVGQVLMGMIGLWCDVTPESWRWTFIAGSIPALVGILCLLIVPESARWLAERANRKQSSADPFRELFQPPLRQRVIIGILIGAVPVVGTAANAQWIVPWTDQVESAKQARPESAKQGLAKEITSSEHEQSSEAKATTSTSSDRAPESRMITGKKPDPKSKARTIVSRSGGAVLGSLLGGILASVLGRRTTYFLISLLSLIASSVIFGWMHPSDPWFQTATFVFGLVGVIYFGWLPLYLPELFPTRVRAAGTGITFNSGRIVAGFVVLGTGMMISLVGGNYARIGLWTGAIYGIGMILILFAPRTDESKLSE